MDAQRRLVTSMTRPSWVVVPVGGGAECPAGERAAVCRCSAQGEEPTFTAPQGGRERGDSRRQGRALPQVGASYSGYCQSRSSVTRGVVIGVPRGRGLASGHAVPECAQTVPLLSPPLGVSQAIVSPSFVSAEWPQVLPRLAKTKEGCLGVKRPT